MSLNKKVEQIVYQRQNQRAQMANIKLRRGGRNMR